MPGIERVMRGILRFCKNDRSYMIEQFVHKPYTVFFACMDHRVVVTRFTQSEVGDDYVVRNAGNLVPHACNFSYESATTEPGALELGCVVNGIRNVVVCGHSDCKGMKALYDMRDNMDDNTGSPLQLWLKRHGKFSLDKFKQLTPHNSFQGPLEFQGENDKFLAYIDHESLYPMYDKLSQVNCLQQVENIASYEFMQKKMTQNEVRIHSMWFDIYRGEVHLFSRSRQKFLIINDENLDHLLLDTKREIQPPLE